MTEPKCEKCGSTNGSGIYCDGFGCGREECGELKYFSCECGHMTSFYHITTLGEEVLDILLEPESSEETTKKLKTSFDDTYEATELAYELIGEKKPQSSKEG